MRDTNQNPIHFILQRPVVPLQLEKKVAVLNIIKGKEVEFEATFSLASNIIASMPGYVYHHFYDPFPTVEHYEAVQI